MEEVVKFLKDANTYYLATVEAISREFVPSELPTFLRENSIFRQER